MSMAGITSEGPKWNPWVRALLGRFQLTLGCTADNTIRAPTNKLFFFKGLLLRKSVGGHWRVEVEECKMESVWIQYSCMAFSKTIKSRYKNNMENLKDKCCAQLGKGVTEKQVAGRLLWWNGKGSRYPLKPTDELYERKLEENQRCTGISGAYLLKIFQVCMPVSVTVGS